MDLGELCANGHRALLTVDPRARLVSVRLRGRIAGGGHRLRRVQLLFLRRARSWLGLGGARWHRYTVEIDPETGATEPASRAGVAPSPRLWDDEVDAGSAAFREIDCRSIPVGPTRVLQIVANTESRLRSAGGAVELIATLRAGDAAASWRVRLEAVGFDAIELEIDALSGEVLASRGRDSGGSDSA